MNFWLNINSAEEPINNTNYISNKELQVTDEDLELIRDVLKVLTSDLLDN
jgi:hypothetical protein